VINTSVLRGPNFIIFLTNMAGSEGNPQGELLAIQMQALTSHLEKLFDRKLEEIHRHMDQMKNQIVNRQAFPRRDDHEGGWSQNKEYDHEEEKPIRRIPIQNNKRRYGNQGDDDLE